MNLLQSVWEDVRIACSPFSSIFEEKALVWKVAFATCFGLSASLLRAEDVLISVETIEREIVDDCLIERFQCRSPVMGRVIRGWIVLPPAYREDEEATFPILYALHGYAAPYDTYSKMSHLRRALNERPMIVAGFDGDKGSWYLDSTVLGSSQFTTFFFKEFLPSVEARWRVNGSRAITGFSMGGFGAMHLTLTHPEMFVAVSGFSTAIDPLGNLPERIQKEIPNLLGPDFANEESPLRLNRRLAERVRDNGSFPAIYQHCGTSDGLLSAQREFCDILTQLNKEGQDLAPGAASLLSFRFVESPGEHDWKFWNGNVVELLDFHFGQFNQN